MQWSCKHVYFAPIFVMLIFVRNMLMFLHFYFYIIQNGPESWATLILPFAALILVLCILDYYVESVCINHLEVFRTARFSGYSLFLSGLVLSYFWSSPYTMEGSILGRVGEMRIMEHSLTGGVIFSAMLFILGRCWQLYWEPHHNEDLGARKLCCVGFLVM